MTIRLAKLAVALGARVALQAAAQTSAPGAQRVDLGKREFDSNCASCHGIAGKGNGPMAELLTRSAPDLTQLAKRNGGVLPIPRLYEVIDGTSVPSHGTRDMPVWGRDYRLQAGEYYMELPYDPEAYVRVRVLSLIEYISRLQQK